MYWEMTKDYIKEYRKIRDNKITRMAEYGRGEIQRNYLNVYFEEPFNEIPAVYANIEDESGDVEKEIEIVKVTKSSFLVRVTGGILATAKFNWLAVVPGYWETSNGMKLAAGRYQTNREKMNIKIEDHFEGPPALFSAFNSSINEGVAVLQQSAVSETSFEFSTPLDRKTHRSEDAGWIAVETGKSGMWTGRFCTAVTLSNRNSRTVEFTLPRYFYDDVLTLVKSNAGNNGGSGEPFVIKTSNLGGHVKYQKNSVPDSDILNIISFDGGGGSLYGSSLHK
jgi:hypothetical protein